MNDDMDWIKAILAKIDDRQDSQASTLVRLTTTVEDHVRRTNLLEEDIKPIRAHVNFMTMGGKVLLGAITVIGFLRSISII